jgi:hypothetical protein
VEAPTGWGGVEVGRPVDEEGWPGVRPEDHVCFEGGRDGWPDLSLPPSSGVLVTTTTTIEKEGGHSAQLLMLQHRQYFSRKLCPLSFLLAL